MKQHKNFMFLSERLEEFKTEWSKVVPREIIVTILKHGKYGHFRLGRDIRELINSTKDEFTENSSGDVWNLFETTAHYLGESIRDYRRLRKHVEDYSPVKDAAKSSLNHAKEIFDMSFMRSNISCTQGDEWDLKVEHEDTYAQRSLICVPVSWKKTVYDKGFSLISSPKGKRFILRCKPVDVKYIDDEGYNAWKVTAVGFYKNKGFTEDGWLITHKSTEHDDLHPLFSKLTDEMLIPHSFGTDLSKAFSLMKNRTVRHLTKMMTG